MSMERPRRTAGTGSSGVGRSKVRTSAKSGGGWSKLLVSLRGVDAVHGDGAEGRAGQYAAMRALANQLRDEVLEYLRANAEPDAWRKPSDVTVFGTFTIDCTPSGQRTLRHAPHVQSVIRAGDTPLRVIR